MERGGRVLTAAEKIMPFGFGIGSLAMDLRASLSKVKSPFSQVLFGRICGNGLNRMG